MKKIIAIATTAILVTGCGSLLPKGGPAPRLYTLNGRMTASPSATPDKVVLPYSLKILKPQAAPGLETERIALRKNNNQIDYYADARWATDAPSLLQAALVESFETSRRLRSVSNDLVVLKSDYDLLIELRDFQAMYKGSGTESVHVRMTAKLINTATEEIVRTWPYERVEPVKGQGLSYIVAAFDRAQHGVSRQLVGDVLAILPVQPVPAAKIQK